MSAGELPPVNHTQSANFRTNKSAPKAPAQAIGIGAFAQAAAARANTHASAANIQATPLDPKTDSNKLISQTFSQKRYSPGYEILPKPRPVIYDSSMPLNRIPGQAQISKNVIKENYSRLPTAALKDSVMQAGAAFSKHSDIGMAELQQFANEIDHLATEAKLLPKKDSKAVLKEINVLRKQLAKALTKEINTVLQNPNLDKAAAKKEFLAARDILFHPSLKGWGNVFTRSRNQLMDAMRNLYNFYKN